MWSELSSKSGPICLQKLVRVVFKTCSELSLQSGQSWPKNGSDFTLNIGPSRPGKVVWVVFKKWSELSLQSGQSWPKMWSDFTLNIGPSCPRKVVRVVLKKWSELSWSELSCFLTDLVFDWVTHWRHDITEILLKVALNTINQTWLSQSLTEWVLPVYWNIVEGDGYGI